MSALSLPVPSAQAVLAFPFPAQTWLSSIPQPTESPILSAAAPPTITETLTITLPAPPAPPKSTWRSPKTMLDLGAFNISAFSGGRANLEIIQGVPPILASSSADAGAHWPHDPSASALQLRYPAGSINPAQRDRPTGGAQFYAAPLDLARAHNVSLAYSAFFPAAFDWVRGGKMPGLYGGRSGCSGGSPARDCWSTRLMWRAAGRGELYLYAPRAKQPASLCAAPRSVCSAAYGLSVGRGAFAWAPGRWTRVVQTVTLNTPGRPDGCFVLDVDGVRVIERCDVFYRDVRGGDAGEGGGEGDAGEGGGGLGGLLGTLLSDLFKRDATTAPTPTPTPTRMYDAQQAWGAPASASASADDDEDDDDEGQVSVDAHAQEEDAQVVGFTGLFFSSFFGGHTARYATPTDQYVWFKDFYISYNS